MQAPNYLGRNRRWIFRSVPIKEDFECLEETIGKSILQSSAEHFKKSKTFIRNLIVDEGSVCSLWEKQRLGYIKMDKPLN